MEEIWARLASEVSGGDARTCMRGVIEGSEASSKPRLYAYFTPDDSQLHAPAGNIAWRIALLISSLFTKFCDYQ